MTAYDDEVEVGPLISVAEAAAYLSISKDKIRYFLKHNALSRVDVGGCVRIPLREVHNAAREGLVIPPPEPTENELSLRKLEVEVNMFRQRIANKYGALGLARAANRMDPRHFDDPDDPEDPS